MARRGGRRGTDDDESTADRILAKLEEYEPGVHDLGQPANDLDSALPPSLISVYLLFDGARLFFEALVLSPAAEFEAAESDESDKKTPPRWRVGEVEGDEILVDGSGAVWRAEAATGDVLLDGTAFDRWLLGMIDAEALLYERDGEFREDVFDDDGELIPTIAQAQLKVRVKRDPRAPAPRWLLARALSRAGDTDHARTELEEVVAAAPAFGWAWLDLARLSERSGELDGAIDEAIAAAEADPAHEQAAFFWAHAARIAALKGDDPRRADLAARALAANPDLARSFRDGAGQNLEDGETASARELAELAAAIAPRDVATLDLLRRIRATATDA